MSKVREKKVDPQKGLLELDVKFEKIIQFSGWVFLFALALFMGGWVVLDTVLNIIDLNLNAMTFSLIIFIGTNSAVSFGLASKIKNDRTQKRQILIDWLVGEFLLAMFSIFAVAAYQW
jgi:hypothetical protein